MTSILNNKSEVRAFQLRFYLNDFIQKNLFALSLHWANLTEHYQFQKSIKIIANPPSQLHYISRVNDQNRR